MCMQSAVHCDLTICPKLAQVCTIAMFMKVVLPSLPASAVLAATISNCNAAAVRTCGIFLIVIADLESYFAKAGLVQLDSPVQAVSYPQG